jgi:hypothetical protein
MEISSSRPKVNSGLGDRLRAEGARLGAGHLRPSVLTEVRRDTRLKRHRPHGRRHENGAASVLTDRTPFDRCRLAGSRGGQLIETYED